MQQGPLERGGMHLPDSKTVNGIADMPMTDRSREVVAEFSPSPARLSVLFPQSRTRFRGIALRQFADIGINR